MDQLSAIVRLSPQKRIGPAAAGRGIRAEEPVLVVLAAGKGTRFGTDPKCIQSVAGKPLARHTIDAFHGRGAGACVCIVGYRHEDVVAALGADNLYVLSDNPAGGTALAAYEAFCIPDLLERNPLLILTMGDRIVPPETLRRLLDAHAAPPREADLTLLTARYIPPANRGKGRIVRDGHGRVTAILEERDIEALPDPARRAALLSLAEGNCPLYAIRAAALHDRLRALTNRNAQGQFYLTDIVAALQARAADIRTLTTSPGDPEYDLLCADVTRPADLARLEAALAKACLPRPLPCDDLAALAAALAADRPPVQSVAIGRQLHGLHALAVAGEIPLDGARPLGVGIAGGRLRIAFMHPDMARFYGPAWQMPTGAGHPDGDGQMVVLVQETDDRLLHVHALNPRFRANSGAIPADAPCLFPGPDALGPHAFEAFGTRLSEYILSTLGYATDAEVEGRRRRGLPLPAPDRRVSANLRHPFTLVANALASLRTLRDGPLGQAAQDALGPDRCRGLRFIITGDLPQGGFSSSSALTVAALNALCALFNLPLATPDRVRAACQAEYGTGVRAGSLDQTTIQSGRPGQGTLVSSNPREDYRVLGVFPAPTDRFRILFPYSVERDRAAWQWSWGAYAERPGQPTLTAGEMRKMTGKAAEIAAILIGLPPDCDFFAPIRQELLDTGALSPASRAWIAGVLRAVPLRTPQTALRAQLAERRAAYALQLAEAEGLDEATAAQKAGETLESLLAGWRDPLLRRTDAAGRVVEESGVPLRATLAYLFAEVARNFHLIHHPESWIESVTLSQRGDRCADMDWTRLPTRAEMERRLDWEAGAAGPDLLARWLERHDAVPWDHNRGLDDASLEAATPPDMRFLPGGSFFRGLALLDLAEAMLKRAFGGNAVAVRVNAAGQGDYFQVHVDRERADPDEVKAFIRAAFYRRFGLSPSPEFVELHPGGGAVGLRLAEGRGLDPLASRLAPGAGSPAPA